MEAIKEYEEEGESGIDNKHNHSRYLTPRGSRNVRARRHAAISGMTIRRFKGDINGVDHAILRHCEYLKHFETHYVIGFGVRPRAV